MKHKSRCTKQPKYLETRSRLPDLEISKTAVLNSLTSVDGQRGYSHAIDEFVDWYCSALCHLRSQVSAAAHVDGNRRSCNGERIATMIMMTRDNIQTEFGWCEDKIPICVMYTFWAGLREEGHSCTIALP